jgi:hypothetical protein
MRVALQAEWSEFFGPEGLGGLILLVPFVVAAILVFPVGSSVGWSPLVMIEVIFYVGAMIAIVGGALMFAWRRQCAAVRRGDTPPTVQQARRLPRLQLLRVRHIRTRNRAPRCLESLVPLPSLIQILSEQGRSNEAAGFISAIGDRVRDEFETPDMRTLALLRRSLSSS